MCSCDDEDGALAASDFFKCKVHQYLYIKMLLNMREINLVSRCWLSRLCAYAACCYDIVNCSLNCFCKYTSVITYAFDLLVHGLSDELVLQNVSVGA